MVVTVYKYTIENDLTQKKKKKKAQTNGMYLGLSKLLIKQDM